MSAPRPILNSICEDELSHPDLSAISPAPQWYAAYTLSRHEKKAALHLETRGVETFLPLYDSTRNWNGRRERIKLPLFPGYLFVYINACDRMRVLESPSIVRLISSSGKLTPLPETDVQALKAALKIRTSQPFPFFATGRRVQVKRGPLRGLVGVVMRNARELRVVITIETIMRSFSVELDYGDLEPIFSPERHQARNLEM
jgi:transcription termination/antitermination protein NusG